MAVNGIYNFPAHLAQRQLRKSNVRLALATAQLSAGQRVQAARDDAAALAIGSRFGAELAGLHRAHGNAGQAASVLQIADGGMARIGDILGRMKELAVQAGSGQLAASGRRAISAEFQALAGEIDRIAADTGFAGTNLLDGSAGNISFKIGSGADPAADELTVSLDGVSTAALSIDGADVSTAAGADAAVAAIDNAIASLQTFRTGIGASRNRLDHAAASIATSIENTESARSALIDLDVPAATADLSGLELLSRAGLSMLNQANRHAKPVLRLVV